jgi:Fe-S cluster assembly protein SufD
MTARPGRDWLGELRERALERFSSMPWPTPELEDWRRTDLSRFDLQAYFSGGEVSRAADGAPGGDPVPAAGRGRDRELKDSCPSSVEPGGAAGFMRFDGGRCAELACADGLRSLGVRLESLDASAGAGSEELAAMMAEALEKAQDRVAVLHFARLDYGAFLYVPPGVEIEEPFFIDIDEGGAGPTPRLSAPQVAIILGEGARATVISRLAEGPGSRLLCAARSDIALGEGAALRLFDSQSLGPDSLYFHKARAGLGRGSSLERVEVELGGRLVKTSLDCSLEGRGAEARLDGIYYCGPAQHMDIGAALRHASPGATSKAYYKGAAAGGGRAVFQGLIEVGEGASGTDAYLSNRNLLLGEASRADSIPTLKIGNDDVRCSHGSATGRLGKEELFYLQSRGLSPGEAREMLLLGFFEEILARAPEAFREEALAGIRSRLPDAA